MNKLNNNLKKNFTVIPNEIIRNNKISDRARFLFCYMASMPDDWKFYQQNMASDLGYSIETLRKYIDELLSTGYLRREQRRDSGKFDSYDYTIDFTPIPTLINSGNPPCVENTDTVFYRHGVLPTRENLALTNTNTNTTNTNTNTTNTNTNTTKEPSLKFFDSENEIQKEKKDLAQKKEISEVAMPSKITEIEYEQQYKCFDTCTPKEVSEPPNALKIKNSDNGFGIENKIVNKKASARKKGNGTTFNLSEYFDVNRLREKIYENEKYRHYNIEYYYEALKNWAMQGDGKDWVVRIDWPATCRTFILGDIKQNKAVLINNQNKNYEKQHSASTESILRIIEARHSAKNNKS